MCIIVVKKSGVKYPDKSILRDCFESNPDGAGYMFIDGNVHIRKGFMKFKAFYKDLMENTVVDNDIVMHFRIGTSGGTKCQENTHPFPVSPDCQKLKQLDIRTEIGCAHNGIIAHKGDGTLSDTMVFIRDILSDPLIIENIKRPSMYKLLDKYVNGSKLAIMDSDNITIFGQGWITQDDIMYSNDSFERTYWYSTKYIPKHSKYKNDIGFNDTGLGEFVDDDLDFYSSASAEKCPVCGSMYTISFEDSWYCQDCNAEFTVTHNGETYLSN